MRFFQNLLTKCLSVTHFYLPFYIFSPSFYAGVASGTTTQEGKNAFNLKDFGGWKLAGGISRKLLDFFYDWRPISGISGAT
jgi:hypothetical protein